MLKTIKIKYLELSITLKILIAMLTIAIIVSGVVGFMCTYFYTGHFKTQYNQQAKDSMSSTIFNTNYIIKSTYKNSIYLLTDAVFKDIYKYSAAGNKNPDFVNDYTRVAGLLSAFINSNTLIDNAAVISANGQVYTTFEAGYGYTPDDFSKELEVTGIVWLPAGENPLSKSSDKVVTLCFPIKVENDVLTFTNDIRPNMVFAIYINIDRLSISIERTNRVSFSSSYLTDRYGTPLYFRESDEMLETVTGQSFLENLLSDRSFEMTGRDGVSYEVISEDVGISGIKLVNIAARETVYAGIKSIQRAALLSILISFVIAILLARGISASLTIPFKLLLDQVKKISSGDYEIEPVIVYGNEHKTLDTALCDMASTIRTQIKHIKETEVKRRKAEMAAISEQINPHFLYNTLDCIHWEILGGNQEQSAKMIESLGAFLRLSLSKGKKSLTLEESIEHTRQFINIISYRFSSDIQFKYSITADCERFLLPRMVLLPLVENSFHHGFKVQQPDPSIVKPTIRISAYKRDGFIMIDVEDNGRGIDAEHARKCMLGDSSDTGHVGLSNIYHRLKYRFGDKVNIEFMSVPYYSNIVRIIIPERPEFDE